MKKSIITLGILAASALGALTSCEDMMTIETGDKAYINANDTLYSYLGIMRAMQDVAERQVILGEIRGDLVSSTEYTTDTLYAISNFDNPQDQTCSMLQVSDYYNLINNCNFYIHNCDTSAVKSNIKYMIPEYAQVKSIRAWAYLQLVKNYKEVPFITEPVNNLSVIKNFDYKANLVSKDNLAEKLIEDGILDFLDTKYPGYGTGNKYGTWENGSVSISARLCYIPIRVVMGDIYLLRGSSQSDYEKAAQYYYDYLKNESTPLPLSYIEATNYRNGMATGITYVNGYGTWGSTYDYDPQTTEVISLIPSSANAGLGKMLTRVADIFGYTPTSSQSSDETVNEDNEGTGEFEASGSISVTYNYKRQYGPSQAYNDVVNSQTAVYYPRLANGYSTIPAYIPEYDARNEISVQQYAYEGVGYPLCSKAAMGREFYYTIPIYRKSLIWLRLAEAINRAGFPEYAFGILKDGLNKFNLPTLADLHIMQVDSHGYYILVNSRDDITVYEDWDQPEGEPSKYYYYDADGNFVEYPEKVSGSRWEYQYDIIPESIVEPGSYEALNYVTDIEQVRKFNAFLNFSDDIWSGTYGIHARGAGFGNFVAQDAANRITNITGSLDTVCFDYSKLLLQQNVKVGVSSKDDIINAVENIIVDELALETAFEGNRFTDLVRIADHKNAAGQNGTEWLAKKIANRGSRKATLNSPAIESFDAAIYSKLQNQSNWYFQLPAWTVK